MFINYYVDVLYIDIAESGRGMKSVEECIRNKEFSLSDYLKRSGVNDDGVLDAFVKEGSATEYNDERTVSRENGWKEKVLHGQYPTLMEEKSTETWNWLKAGWLKKEMEGPLLAA